MSGEKRFFAHPTALVETDEIGDGTRIWAYAHVMSGARIGARCNVCDHCFVESGAVVGDDCTVKNGVSIWDGVTLEDGVFLGPNAALTNDPYPRAFPPLKTGRAGWRTTLLRRGATVGANATIVCGATVGRYAFVAAGAVVTGDVADHALVAGIPVRRIAWACACGRPLPSDLRCPCGRAWADEGGAFRQVGGPPAP